MKTPITSGMFCNGCESLDLTRSDFSDREVDFVSVSAASWTGRPTVMTRSACSRCLSLAYDDV